MSKQQYAKIVAVDFDGCLVTNNWPEIGEPIERVIEQYRLERAAGTKFILWTCRSGKKLDDAVAWCAERDITFDAVNEPLPEVLAVFDGDPRKVFANEYWDDRAVCMPPLPLDGDTRESIFREVSREYRLEDIKSRLEEMDEDRLCGLSVDALCSDDQFLDDVLSRWEKSEGRCDILSDTNWELCDLAIEEVLKGE